jgi:NAD(P)-dependent dehydrogenase (short-subunit alcohol dehydrogenase family)
MPSALVTGTSTGIGQATAISLARKGYAVYAAMRNTAAAGPLEKAAADETLSITPIAMDVDDDASVTRGVAQVLEADGRIDVLVNNAGIGGGGAVERTPLATFRRVMETNFFGLLRCTQAVIPAMRRQQSGFIANIGGASGIALSPMSTYAASKFAMRGLSECLAQELRPFGVRVAVIEPGVILTPIFSKEGEPVPEDAGYPQGRRYVALIGAVLPNASSPFEVGDRIAELAANGDDHFRHWVGYAATELCEWRQGMSDSEWVAVGGMTDAEFAASVKAGLGLDLKL